MLMESPRYVPQGQWAGIALFYICMYFIKYTTCIIFQYDRAFYISVRSTIFAEEVKLIGEGEGWGTFTR